MKKLFLRQTRPFHSNNSNSLNSLRNQLSEFTLIQMNTLVQSNNCGMPDVLSAPYTMLNSPNSKNTSKQYINLNTVNFAFKNVRSSFMNKKCTIKSNFNNTCEKETKVLKSKVNYHSPTFLTEFKGHPKCEFCDRALYSSDQLYEHLERNHFTCHICEKDGHRFQYYKDYNQLEKHFGSAHYLCPERDCLEKKFIVFRTLLDLQAHEVKSLFKNTTNTIFS